MYVKAKQKTVTGKHANNRRRKHKEKVYIKSA